MKSPGHLIGRHVFLRPPRAGDGVEFIALNRASRNFHRGWAQPPVTRTQFAGYLRRARSPGSECFFVCCREDGAIAGAMNFGQIFRGASQSAYLGYFIGAPFAGRGYMTEAIRLALRHAFLGLKLHRVEANVQPGNAASLALVKRAGFRREGFSPRYLKIAGRWRDHERWALTVEDWRRHGKKG